LPLFQLKIWLGEKSAWGQGEVHQSWASDKPPLHFPKPLQEALFVQLVIGGSLMCHLEYLPRPACWALGCVGCVETTLGSRKWLTINSSDSLPWASSTLWALLRQDPALPSFSFPNEKWQAVWATPEEYGLGNGRRHVFLSVSLTDESKGFWQVGELCLSDLVSQGLSSFALGTFSVAESNSFPFVWTLHTFVAILSRAVQYRTVHLGDLTHVGRNTRVHFQPTLIVTVEPQAPAWKRSLLPLCQRQRWVEPDGWTAGARWLYGIEFAAGRHSGKCYPGI
jgi:hypothetical protein